MRVSKIRNGVPYLSFREAIKQTVKKKQIKKQPITSFKAVALKRRAQRLHLMARSNKKRFHNLALRIVGHSHAVL